MVSGLVGKLFLSLLEQMQIHELLNPDLNANGLKTMETYLWLGKITFLFCIKSFDTKQTNCFTNCFTPPTVTSRHKSMSSKYGDRRGHVLFLATHYCIW